MVFLTHRKKGCFGGWFPLDIVKKVVFGDGFGKSVVFGEISKFLRRYSCKPLPFLIENTLEK